MKSAPFTYTAPTGVEEAVSLLVEYGEDARPLAGGQSLMPLLALRMARPTCLVDLNGIDSLRTVRTDGELTIGAMTRQAVIERSAEIAGHCQLLVDATRLIGHFQIRSRGTLGGSIAHADPAAEYPAVALVLGAEAEVTGRSGPRRVAMADLFRSAWTTAIGADELLTAVHIPAPAPRTGHAIDEITRRPGDFALAGAAATVTVDQEGAVADVRVVVFGVADRPLRVPSIEAALLAGGDGRAVDALATEVAADLNPMGDVLASAAYRRRMAARLIASVVRTAGARATEGSG